MPVSALNSFRRDLQAKWELTEIRGLPPIKPGTFADFQDHKSAADPVITWLGPSTNVDAATPGRKFFERTGGEREAVPPDRSRGTQKYEPAPPVGTGRKR
jgi:hypothetical protein